MKLNKIHKLRKVPTATAATSVSDVGVGVEKTQVDTVKGSAQNFSVVPQQRRTDQHVNKSMNESKAFLFPLFFSLPLPFPL